MFTRLAWHHIHLSEQAAPSWKDPRGRQLRRDPGSRRPTPDASSGPAARRASVSAQAELPGAGDRDPPETQRPLSGGGDASRFFAADSHLPRAPGDWRLFRARLVARERRGDVGGSPASAASAWAHPITRPEQGCLLVGRQPDLGLFTHSVLLVSEHDNAKGTRALMLNAPTPMCIAHLGLEEETTAAFGRNPLFLGGPVNKNLLHVLHGRREVEGAMQIMDGVYAGGVDSAIELVRRGTAQAHDFRLLAGYSGWAPFQLEREVAEGAWWVVAASPAFIHSCLRATSRFEPLSTATRAGGEGDAKLSCWSWVLRVSGVVPPR